jgi:signal transduction histidine kinase
VAGSHVQLEQVFVNLLSNAGDAVRTAPEKHIQLTCEVQGETVVVTVQDSGIGISPEVLPRIFEPFFTTKGVNQGTGLGLSITHGIITEHGGSIEVHSMPGQGTTFVVRLPLAPTG